MDYLLEFSEEQIKYLKLLSEKYINIQSVCREIINLKAILNLPKGTEHFMSDLHGEYEAFYHILNNCSGVIKEKVEKIFSDRLSVKECQEICTLIYYPDEKMERIKKQQKNTFEWYKMILQYLIELAGYLSSKYTRSKVRKALPNEFSYIIDELLHAQKDEDDNQFIYHEKILETIIKIQNADEFIVALTALIKRLAVDHLHIVGDIFDRGDRADEIIELLMQYHSLDIEWGNHDILWMGAASGSDACIANVIRNNVKYKNMKILENGYGISLRSLSLFAERTYKNLAPHNAVLTAITVILLKLEGQVIKRNPEFMMEERLLLHQINYKNKTITMNGHVYELTIKDFPTIHPECVYELTEEESEIIEEFQIAFKTSQRLRKHMDFLYEKGSMYLCYNNNLLFHGCIPLDQNGNFEGVKLNGKIYQGKEYLDFADKNARLAYLNGTQQHCDFMWYLWCGNKSPLSGRTIKTFERTFLSNPKTWEEEKNPYYQFYQKEKICAMILREFNLYSNMSHIINGHTPIRTGKGEAPIKSNGKLLVIDGGFCKAYQKTTGIAGYTLIFNSHGMRIKAHQPFESIHTVLDKNKDIESSSDIFETQSERVMVMHTDNGKRIANKIQDLLHLLAAYRKGIL